MTRPAIDNLAVPRPLPTPWVWLVPLLLLGSPRVARADEGTASDQILVALIIPLLLGAIVLAAFALRAYRRDRARAQARLSSAARLGPARAQSEGAPPLAITDSGSFSAMVALSLTPTEQQRLPVPVPPAVDVKVCRACDREFRTALQSCPFDQTKLVPKSSLESTPERLDYLDTQRSLMRCSLCSRQYDLGTKYCPYDGEALEAVEEDDERIYYDGQMRCPQCHDTFDEEAYFCPNDGVRLLPVEPTRHHLGYAALPLVICPECMSEYPVSQTRCPEDDSELLPLAGRHTGGHPATGMGDRSRVCPQCGSLYGSDTRYCAIDGVELLTVN